MLKQQLNDKFSILSYYKALIQLKKSDLIYTYGKFNMVDAENKQVLHIHAHLKTILY